MADHEPLIQRGKVQPRAAVTRELLLFGPIAVFGRTGLASAPARLLSKLFI